MFITYPLRPYETADSLAMEGNLTANLLQMYNPGVNFKGSGIVYIPGRGDYFVMLLLCDFCCKKLNFCSC